MKKATDLLRTERMEIDILLSKGYSLRSIARALGRSPNTISYEVRKNSVQGVYDPLKANAKARFRKRMRKFQWSKIEEHPLLKAFIIERLEAHWNPDEIAGFLKRNRNRYPWYVSKTAIYEWLRTMRGERYCAYLYSKRRRVKRRRSKTKKEMIPNRVDIRHRMKGAGNRSRYGHFESDTLVGRKGTRGGVKIGYERKARLVVAFKVLNMRPAHHAQTERRMFRMMRARSITRDNGIENRDHEKVEIPSFFCHPYAAWQKGGVENANKMIRRYFPKGTDFASISQEELNQVVFIINGKPRKILGYRSALEVARAAGVIIKRECPN